MPSKTVKIPRISCGHCIRTIETELKELDHIVTAKAEINTKTLTVEWQEPQNWENIKKLLEEINYPPEG